MCQVANRVAPKLLLGALVGKDEKFPYRLKKTCGSFARQPVNRVVRNKRLTAVGMMPLVSCIRKMML